MTIFIIRQPSYQMDFTGQRFNIRIAVNRDRIIQGYRHRLAGQTCLTLGAKGSEIAFIKRVTDDNLVHCF